METVGVTISRQTFFDSGGRDPEELHRAAVDAATDFLAELPPERRNDLTDIMDTGVDLWEAMEALGIVRSFREPGTIDPCACNECKKDHAVRDRYRPDQVYSDSAIEWLMRASIQPDKKGGGGSGKSAKKKPAGPHRGEPPMATSYAWKLKQAG